MACSSFLSDQDLRRFRTKLCRRTCHQQTCEFGADRCQYSHNLQWPRRCPFYLTHQSTIRYLPEPCPDVVIADSSQPGQSTIGLIVSNKCSRGGSCPYAHSLEETLYHPLKYKTELCQDFLRGYCSRYYCPYVHGTAETRDVNNLSLNLPLNHHEKLHAICESYPNLQRNASPTHEGKKDKHCREKTDFTTSIQRSTEANSDFDQAKSSISTTLWQFDHLNPAFSPECKQKSTETSKIRDAVEQPPVVELAQEYVELLLNHFENYTPYKAAEKQETKQMRELPTSMTFLSVQ